MKAPSTALTSSITRAKHLLCPLCLHSQESNNTANDATNNAPASTMTPLLSISNDQRSLVCEHNHTFDIAKQGYVNLLPVQQKKSLTPGDSKDMVLARKKFLNLGYYQPLVDALIQTCNASIPKDKSAPILLDAGCGEGYYSDHIQQALIQQHPELVCYGFDIAKPAVKEAAKRNAALSCFVSTIKAIPLVPQSCDIIISVFSPMQPAQFQRLLQSGGSLIVLCAGKQHLHQLKSLLYDSTNDYNEDKFLAQLDSHFTLVQRTSIQQTMNLSSQHDIAALLAMTPHFWRASPEAKQKLNGIDRLEVDIDVQLMLFHPKRPLTAHPKDTPPQNLA